MTPDEVHDVSFGRPPPGHRGYDQQAVDDLLDRIEATLRGTPRIRREELNSLLIKRPRVGQGGYSAVEVDAFLQRVVAEWPQD
jgi:DivIVA domain-containing protein